jgi:hypothetical protein
MANGAVVRLPLTGEPPATPDLSAVTDRPDGLGAAVASAVFVLDRGILDQQENDALAPATKAAGADRIAALAVLQLDFEGGDDDFFRRAHEAGKCELRRFFNNTDLFRQRDPAEIDKVFDASISDVLGVVSGVVRDERAFRAAWVH